MTNTRDFASDLVIRHLHDQDVEVTRLNIDDLTATSLPPWSLDAGLLQDPDIVWHRQFLPTRPVHTLQEADELLVQRRQWASWLDVLTDGPLWVNPLWKARRAESKVLQLRTAQHCGLRIPATLITNSPSHAETFSKQHGPCVVKAIAAPYFELSDQSFAFTATLEEALEAPHADWHAQPVLVQQSLKKGEDIRAIVFGGVSFSAQRERASIDWRLNTHEGWQTHSLPEPISGACERYLAALDLRYGAFDFIRDSAGWYWFLECNQAGEWAWIDRQLELGIGQYLAKYFASIAEE